VVLADNELTSLHRVSAHEILEDGPRHEIDSATPETDRKELVPF